MTFIRNVSLGQKMALQNLNSCGERLNFDMLINNSMKHFLQLSASKMKQQRYLAFVISDVISSEAIQN